eukprot:4766729-Amphidinium_carterae.1
MEQTVKQIADAKEDPGVATAPAALATVQSKKHAAFPVKDQRRAQLLARQARTLADKTKSCKRQFKFGMLCARSCAWS